MSLLDTILNLAGLLLWFGWRAVGLDLGARPAALSLASTLRRAETPTRRSWAPLLTLFLLITLRPLLYWQLALQTQWTPTLDLGVVTLPFRLDLWSRALVFSCFSFLHALIAVHLWLLLVNLLGRRGGESDSVYAVIRAQFGAFARLPAAVQVVLLPILGAAFWLVLAPCLRWLGLTSPPPANLHAWQQASAFGLGLFLAWKPAAIVLLAIHMVNSYVYLGISPAWECAARCGRNLVRHLPLAIARVDLAPLVGILFVLLAFPYAERGLLHLFSRPFP